MNISKPYEYVKFEGAKQFAGGALKVLGGSSLGREVVSMYSSPVDNVNDYRLCVRVADIEFDNPVMVGAGWDKTGEYLLGLNALGFSGVEVGTVTPRAQVGNDRPRLWTFGPGHSIAINRMGFNSPGMDVVADNLDEIGDVAFPVGINVGKNKLTPNNRAAEDYFLSTMRLARYAGYVAINISSPNTPGLRDLQGATELRELIQATQDALDAADCAEKPVFVKIAPELSGQQIDDVIGVVCDEGCAGIIATNTTTSRVGVEKFGARWVHEAGGLSGAYRPYQERSTEVIRHIRRNAPSDLEIIGVGGVNDLNTALEKLQAGASILQVVTAIRSSYGRVAKRINRGLANWMDMRGVKSIGEIIGTDIQ